MSASQQTIDFAKIDGPVYTGRDRGERLRSELELDKLDAVDGVVDVRIPATVYTMSSSFFLGLFGPSVLRFGTKEAFFKHYRFASPEFLDEVLETYASRALQSRRLFS